MVEKVLYTDFLTIDVGTILFTLFNTLLIFLAFRFILFKRVDAIVEKRKNEVDATYTEAEKARSEANADKEKYAAAMSGAKQEAAELLSRAEKKAQKEGDAILAEARSAAQTVRERATAETERERVQARTELQGEIADLAMELAQKIMEKEINKADHERLIDEFIEEIGEEGDNA